MTRTKKTPTYRELTADELDALQKFKAYCDRKKKKWKDELAFVYWYNARIWRDDEGKERPELHTLRNEFGPTWLASFTL